VALVLFAAREVQQRAGPLRQLQAGGELRAPGGEIAVIDGLAPLAEQGLGLLVGGLRARGSGPGEGEANEGEGREASGSARE
jgi:hypothetical protein